MLETMRSFARARFEQRADAGAIDRRHCEHYLALAERTQPELERTGSPALVAELDHELENLRVAFAWALEHAPELALRLATATALYWHHSRLKSEAADWLAAALAQADESVSVTVRAAALQYYAINLARTSTIDQAERVARESLALRRSSNDLSGGARSASALAHVLMMAHRLQDAHRYARDALKLANAAQDRQARVWLLGTMAMTAPTVREALSIGEQACAAHREAGNQRELASLQTSLVYTALVHGEFSAADPLSIDALDAARAYGDPFVLALAHGNAGLAALLNGRTSAAQHAFVSQLRLGIGYGFGSEYEAFLFEAIDGLAAVAAAEGHDRAAATLSGAAHAATVEHHDPVLARRLDDRFFAPARARLGERAWHDAYSAGATLHPERAIDMALRTTRPRAVA